MMQCSASYIAFVTEAFIILYGFLYHKARKIQKELASNAAANATHRKEWKATITFSLLFLTLIALILGVHICMRSLAVL